MTNGHPRHAIRAARLEDRDLVIRWADDHESRFHPFWLRHHCPCAFCGTTLNAIRGLRLADIPDDITPMLIGWSAAGITIEWSPTDHVSVYDPKWLRDHCYSEAERTLRRHRPTPWDARIGNDPPTFAFGRAEDDPRARLSLLETLADTGFCKIVGAPKDACEAHRLIELIGPQRHTHYGTYTLTGKGAKDNVGDVTFALPPHCDETYRMSTIGITVFQVLNPAVSGGASTLVDGFEAARRLREKHPEDFERLTRTPITGERLDLARNSDGRPRWYLSRRPCIKLDETGEISGVRLNERQISPLDIPAEEIGPTYRALKRIYEILYDPDLMLTFSLEAGEGLIFDNQRVLHGRTSYETEDPPRSVLTSSVDLEEFHSSIRMLRAELGYDGPPILYGQGMTV